MAKGLSKDEFVKCINRLKAARDLQNQVDELFKKSRDNIEWDFLNAASLQISHESMVVTLLENLMDDDEKYPDISYFIYELDYGQRWQPGDIIDRNGEDIDMSTPEKLYDYLTMNRKVDGNAV